MEQNFAAAVMFSSVGIFLFSIVAHFVIGFFRNPIDEEIYRMENTRGIFKPVPLSLLKKQKRLERMQGFLKTLATTSFIIMIVNIVINNI